MGDDDDEKCRRSTRFIFLAVFAFVRVCCPRTGSAIACLDRTVSCRLVSGKALRTFVHDMFQLSCDVRYHSAMTFSDPSQSSNHSVCPQPVRSRRLKGSITASASAPVLSMVRTGTQRGPSLAAPSMMTRAPCRGSADAQEGGTRCCVRYRRKKSTRPALAFSCSGCLEAKGDVPSEACGPAGGVLEDASWPCLIIDRNETTRATDFTGGS
jgi:hypothetical protein